MPCNKHISYTSMSGIVIFGAYMVTKPRGYDQ